MVKMAEKRNNSVVKYINYALKLCSNLIIFPRSQSLSITFRTFDQSVNCLGFILNVKVKHRDQAFEEIT